MGSFGLLGAAAVLISSTVSSMLTFGTYGTFRNRGMGPWGAGAATGAIMGAVGAVGMLLLGDRMAAAFKQTSMSGVFAERVSGMPSTPMVITGLTMSRLSGLPTINGMGLDDLQLGAYGVNPSNMQLMQ